ncbi:GIP [Symbiodinium sp. CCMP2592]|nr:GIP [Symbiodinium sp. CCMP2592]
MADSKEAGGHVPSWDGAARGWRRYTREVAWFVQATPTYKRRYCASKLMSRLTGPARLLAMSWSRAPFDAEDGTLRFLQQLATSPLVRRTLPNAAAICQQYFSFKRSPGETMGNFLVRETLVHEEFTEALIRLHEEKLGVSQADRDFGLPPVESWEDAEWQDGSWWWYGENENDEDQRDGPPGDPDSPQGEREAQGEGPESPVPDDSRLPHRGATGSSPSHRETAAGDERVETGSRVQAPSLGQAAPRPIDELSVADSFIMSVLRGWRLLQAAGLSAEEVRDILSSTRNSLDYETVSQALQGLWDEQLLGQRHRHHQSYQAMASNIEDPDLFYQDYPADDWWDNEADWWDEQAYLADWDDYSSWNGWDAQEDLAYQATSAEPPPDDEKLREAQQAEQIAEQLAVEARRSWTEAQKATQALRRDRGFGANASMASGPRCYNCNGPHLLRDCPQQSWKGRSKGQGKKGYYQHIEDYFIGKGKHKGHSSGKGKKGYWMESYAMGKKGKGKGKTKDPTSRSVNAYSSDLFLGGLEVSEALESTTSPTTSSSDPRKGMLDSGATASAAPEAVVKSLIETVLQCDRSARIELAQYARPFFRFGNGKWSKALGRTTLSSSVSGSLRSFSLYTLPNPSEYYSSHFDKSSLVPVLVGMDFLGPQGVGMIIDFGTGLAMNSKDPSPQIYSLETNKKGHYVLDIAQYLTQGCRLSYSAVHPQQLLQLRCAGQLLPPISRLLLPRVHSLMAAMTTPQLFQLDGATAPKAKAKAKARPLDPARAVTADTRDPRASQETWPCQGRHLPDRSASNAHGQWTHCAVCDLRLQYIPRVGSHAQSTETKNPGMVKRMLEELRPLMQGRKPTATICRHMQRKIDAEEVLRTAITEHIAANPTTTTTATPSTPTTVPSPTTPLDPQGYVQTSSPEAASTTSWTVMQDDQGNDLAAAYAQEYQGSINLQTGYDLYKTATWDQLRSLRQRHRPLRVWFSLPYSKWCPWNNIDYNRAERQERLESDRRKERRMLWHVNCFIKEALEETPDIEIYYEWPHPSNGWKQHPMIDLSDYMDSKHIPWLTCRVDGCNYGLKNSDESAFIQKKWTIKTTDEGFHKNGVPSEDVISYYPWRMVQAITRHWCDRLEPEPETTPEDPLTEHGEPACREEDDVYDDFTMSEVERLVSENMAREARLMKNFSFEALESILEQVLTKVTRKEGQQHRWSSGTRARLLLGGYSHGAFSGVTNVTYRHKELVQYVNAFLQHQLPGHQWSSLLLGLNSGTIPHKDSHNLRYSTNILTCDCGLLVKDPANEKGDNYQMERIRVDTSGQRLSVSAYTTRLTPSLQNDDRSLLRQLGFPLIVDATMVANPAEMELRPATPTTALEPDLPQLPDGVTKEEYRSWEAQISKFHKAAGHPTNRNLAKIVQDANHPAWKVQVARQHYCPACASLRPGGISTGQVPPISTHLQYGAWEAVAVDSGEWIPPGRRIKWKFLMFIDVTTKLRVVQPLFEYNFLEMRSETGRDLIKAFSERWLGCYPKPKVVIMDSAKSFVSAAVGEFFSDINVMTHYVAEKEPWANGIIEAAIQDVKHTASAISQDDPALPPEVVLQLTVAALNATEFTAGYSAHQWAFGKAHRATDEDLRSFATGDPKDDYAKIVASRQRAEEIARHTRARRVLSKLNNTIVRQPVRDFPPMTLVKVWRKVWPKEQYSGNRGGLKKSGRPHWVGPGRVIFNEMLPHQSDEGDRKHVVWVLIGHQLLRCSVHSVRPVDEVERFKFETSGEEDPSRWRTLADVLPRREYQDITDQEPDADEIEMPNLPEQPDASTTAGPPRRVRGKQPAAAEPTTTTANEGPAATSSTSMPTEHPSPEVNDYDQPDSKRAKVDDWVDQLYVDAQAEDKSLDIHTAMEDVEEFLRIEVDVEPPTSNRQKKRLERNPVAYLVKKMRDSEVNIAKLTNQERKLFHRAKVKEVDSFIQNEAVQKCMDDREVREAYDSGRIMRARWVLTWKGVPPEDQDAALKDAKENPSTLHDSKGQRKAKARIVLLGFQHPNLLDRSFKTSSPVQSTLGRNLLYLMAAHHQWDLEGLDLATAFLQTMPTEADQGLYTSGVEELRQALGVSEEGIMKIMKNIYGSTTAPRGLWLDLHQKLTALGAIAIMGERCLWIWLSNKEWDGSHRRVIGAMGGHVDDFHRIGDKSCQEWLDIRQRIDEAYKWGTAKVGRYRHAGTDIATVVDKSGFKRIVVDQEYYIEGLEDIDIEAERLQQDGPLLPRELAACRTALGALQWLAVQSQPQLCSRCNLLLTEAVASGTLQTAREIQAMIAEVRQESFKLSFFKFPTAKHWSDITFISMGDQAHNNRAKGDSTGGLLTLAAGPEAGDGKVCPMNLMSWRTWKLQRKALGSNDAEVQSVYEAEDQNFRVRLLWTEMHGAGGDTELRSNLVQTKEEQVTRVRGILCTDSKGGYDALERNESPLLGLSNMRAALQAFALRDNLKRVRCELRWLASDYDLADAMTKKRADSRVGLLKFLKTWLWSIAFDPNFVSAKRNKKKGKEIGEKGGKGIQLMLMMLALRVGDADDSRVAGAESVQSPGLLYLLRVHRPSDRGGKDIQLKLMMLVLWLTHAAPACGFQGQEIGERGGKEVQFQEIGERGGKEVQLMLMMLASRFAESVP